MAGSPTLLINGVDPFATAQHCDCTRGDDCDCGVSCRLYRDHQGRIVAAPSVGQLREAITAAAAAATGVTVATMATVATVESGEVLSEWRARTLPLDPVERAVHQVILRAFATTGRPPMPHDLDAVTAASGRGAAEVLTTLHDLDAIRLAPDGGIAVAYPFSATATRHRVRIGGPDSETNQVSQGSQGSGGSEGGEGVDVFATCAIDALGMSAMVGQDTRIESVDVTSGRPVIVTMRGGSSRWDPAAAVVFVGAHAAGGPSADCCCDYLNFFTDQDAARAWTSAHPHVPGRILNQGDAEDLAVRLFGHLLAN
jgi:hypothetical protein